MVPQFAVISTKKLTHWAYYFLLFKHPTYCLLIGTIKLTKG